MRVLFFASGSSNESVFASQVIGVVKGWRNHVNIDLAYRAWGKRGAISIAGVNVHCINKMPDVSRLSLAIERFINSSWYDNIHQYDLILCRGPLAAWLTIKSLKKRARTESVSTKILYDCRGISVEEIATNQNVGVRKLINPIKVREIRKIEKYVVENSDYVMTVSNPLADYIKDHYNRPSDIVMPPIVSSNTFRFNKSKRNSIRKEMGIGKGCIMFLFVGGTAHWQRLDLLKKWWDTNRKNGRLIILTHHDQDIMLERLGVSRADDINVVIKSVPHQEVASYISAADIGVLFRDNSLVNRVASPVKLSEYLSCGLPVITNVPEYQNVAPKYVWITDPTGYLEKSSLLELLQFDRNDASKTNNHLFSIDAIIGAILSLYKKP